MSHEKYQRLVDVAKTLQPVVTAVAHPCDESSLSGAIDAAKLGLIKPILVGPKQKIEAAAKAARLDISGYELVDAPHSHAAAAKAVDRGEPCRGMGASDQRRADDRAAHARPARETLIAMPPSTTPSMMHPLAVSA